MKAKKEAETAKKDLEDQKNEDVKDKDIKKVEIITKTVTNEPTLALKKQASNELK